MKTNKSKVDPRHLAPGSRLRLEGARSCRGSAAAAHGQSLRHQKTESFSFINLGFGLVSQAAVCENQKTQHNPRQDNDKRLNTNESGVVVSSGFLAAA